MKFGHLEVFVKEPGKSSAFYCDVLGFELIEVQESNVVWLSLGDFTLLLRPASHVAHADSYQQASSAIVLYCEGLDATMARLQSKGLHFSGTDGSDRCPTFIDPDGNWFQLVDLAEHT